MKRIGYSPENLFKGFNAHSFLIHFWSKNKFFWTLPTWKFFIYFDQWLFFSAFLLTVFWNLSSCLFFSSAYLSSKFLCIWTWKQKWKNVSNEWVDEGCVCLWNSRFLDFLIFVKIYDCINVTMKIVWLMQFMLIYIHYSHVNSNTISLSHHEQVCFIRLCFERCFSHHQPDDGRWWEMHLSKRSLMMVEASLQT